jgi:hypothetical protein
MAVFIDSLYTSGYAVYIFMGKFYSDIKTVNNYIMTVGYDKIYKRWIS